ncbi:MAG: hypothetical protein ACUVTH_04300 [Thermogutta sp.]
MTDSSAERDSDFNPLSAWLGFPPHALPRDYYALLGLKRYESDVHVINRAAETLIAHVREIRPGPYLTEWTQLLDILRAAKACLCDPDRKRAYDEALRSHRITSLTPDLKSLSGQAPNGIPAVRGGESPSSSTTPARFQTTEAEEQPFQNRPAEAEAIHLGLLRTRVWQQRRSSSIARICALGFLIFATTLAYQMFTAPESWRARLRAVIGVAFRSEERPPAGSAMSDAISNTTHGAQASETKSVTPRASEIGPPTNPEHTTSQPKAVAEDPSASSHVRAEQGNAADISVSSPSQPGAIPEPGESRPGDREPDSTLTPPNDTLPGDMRGPPQNAEEEEEAPQNGPPSPAEPPQNKTPAGEELRPEFRALITELWQAMSKRELEEARASLNRLAADVRNESERQAVESLDYLLRHVEEFWRALHRIVPSMKAGEELAIGDTYIVVVDVNRDELVIRAAGQNRRYRIREMPTPLIRIIVARRFRPGPEADAAFGAFLAVDPRGDPREAEQLWRRADDDVLDADVLLEALKFRPSALPR